jgi:hypothetical protein
MGMGGGEGGGGGGVVVSGPKPWASTVAGNYQARAAQAAAAAATSQTNVAIDMIRSQYRNAMTTLKPYTQEGIQALNQWNQYMGLKAYDPGAAPIKPTVESTQEKLGLSNADAVRYVQQNMLDYQNIPVTEAFRAAGGGEIGSIITPNGIEEFDNRTFVGTTVYDPITGEQYQIGYKDSVYATPSATQLLTSGATYGGPNQGNTEALTKNILAHLSKATYQGDLEDYNANIGNYTYAKNLKDQYDAEGPMTGDQVAAKLAQAPGYQFQMGQGIDAIQRAASAKGMMGSGRLLQSLVDYGQGMASQSYGDTLSRLAQMAGAGQQAASQQATAQTNMGNLNGQLSANLGDTIANSYLSSGNALSQALVAGNQQHQVFGGGGGGGGLGGLGSALGGMGSLISAGSGLFSSKTLKDKVSTPTKNEILARVKELNIDVWKYKDIEVNHIGPYAEEFKEQFGVGDGKTINIIDALGVLFASVKELSHKLDNINKETN